MFLISDLSNSHHYLQFVFHQLRISWHNWKPYQPWYKKYSDFKMWWNFLFATKNCCPKLSSILRLSYKVNILSFSQHLSSPPPTHPRVWDWERVHLFWDLSSILQLSLILCFIRVFLSRKTCTLKVSYVQLKYRKICFDLRQNGPSFTESQVKVTPLIYNKRPVISVQDWWPP